MNRIVQIFPLLKYERFGKLIVFHKSFNVAGTGTRDTGKMENCR